MTPDTTTALQQALGAIYRQGYADGVAAVQAKLDSLEIVVAGAQKLDWFVSGALVGAVAGWAVVVFWMAITSGRSRK